MKTIYLGGTKEGKIFARSHIVEVNNPLHQDFLESIFLTQCRGDYSCAIQIEEALKKINKMILATTEYPEIMYLLSKHPSHNRNWIDQDVKLNNDIQQALLFTLIEIRESIVLCQAENIDLYAIQSEQVMK